MNVIQGVIGSQTPVPMDESVDNGSDNKSSRKRKYVGGEPEGRDCKKPSIKLAIGLIQDIWGVVLEYSIYFTAVELTKAITFEAQILKQCAQSSHSLAEVMLFISERWNQSPEDVGKASSVLQSYYRDAQADEDGRALFQGLDIICERLKEDKKKEFITFVLNSLPENIKRLPISLIGRDKDNLNRCIQQEHLEIIGNRFPELEELDLDHCVLSDYCFITYAQNPKASKPVSLSIKGVPYRPCSMGTTFSSGSFFSRLEKLNLSESTLSHFMMSNSLNVKHLDFEGNLYNTLAEVLARLGKLETLKTSVYPEHQMTFHQMTAHLIRNSKNLTSLVLRQRVFEDSWESLETLLDMESKITRYEESLKATVQSKKLRSVTLEFHTEDKSFAADDALHMISNSVDLKDLEELTIHNGRVTDRAILALGKSPYMAKIKSLSLCLMEESKVGEAGICALASSLHLKSLEVLKLERVQLTPKSIELIARSENLKNLRELCLRYIPGLTNQGLCVLAQSEILGNLTTLDLAGCEGSEEGILNIVNSRHLVKLEELSLAWCRNVTDGGISVIAARESMKRLKTLDLSGCAISADAICAIANSPQMAQLQVLKVGGINGTKGLKAIAKSVHLSQLRLFTAYVVRGQRRHATLFEFAEKEDLKNPQVMLCKLRFSSFDTRLTLD